MAEVVGITRVSGATPNKKRHTILAFFDLQLPGVLLKGCALVRYKNGNVVSWPPKIEDRPHPKRRVLFTDEAMARAITDKAVTAFYAMGGTDDELHPAVEC